MLQFLGWLLSVHMLLFWFVIKLSYVVYMFFMFLSFLSKSDVIFHSHLPNMIDCTVAGMTTTSHPESISGQNANAIMPTLETLYKNYFPLPNPKHKSQRHLSHWLNSQLHSDRITSGSDNLAILFKLRLAHINPIITSLLIRVLLLILVIEQ